MKKIIIGVVFLGIVTFFLLRNAKKEVSPQKENPKEERSLASIKKDKIESKKEVKKKVEKFSEEEINKAKEEIRNSIGKLKQNFKRISSSGPPLSKEEISEVLKIIPEDLEPYGLAENKNYFVSKKWRAILKKDYKKEMGEKSFEKIGMVFYKPTGGIDPDDHLKIKEDLPVTYNKDNGMYGVLTGKISLKLNNNSEETLKKVIEKNSLKVLYKAAHINFYFVVPNSNVSSLNLAYKKLKKDENVETAKLEIIETVPTHK
ncbi:hypothetical protein OAK75_08230 [Bacteriovoracales bacterium]|nr:hypothetical protein [Bacteriovoracales bacterium]